MHPLQTSNSSSRTAWGIYSSFIRVRWEYLKEHIKIRPNSGSYLLDIAFILSLVAVQRVIIPSLVGRAHTIDLMTPWLVITCVFHSKPRAIFLCAVGAFALETHSAEPAGFFLCGYWVIGTVIFMTRNYLYWRHLLPWILVFLISEIWLFCFRAVIYAITNVFWELEFTDVIMQFLVMIISCAFGVFLIECQFERDRFVPEE